MTEAKLDLDPNFVLAIIVLLCVAYLAWRKNAEGENTEELLKRARNEKRAFDAMTAKLDERMSSVVATENEKSRIRKSLKPAPGSLAYRSLKALFPKRAFETIFLQIIADMREEYYEALNEGAEWHPLWIELRGHLSLLLAAIAYVMARAGKTVIGIWKIIP